ncbi:multidrug resistance-associated ABC transporter [Earliella scabrosa]|nr:multidrug resistance-associated ABC transporter [Earliella scabrosa]
MQVCAGTSLTTLSDACVRGFWAAIIPTAFVAVVLLTSIPPVRALLTVAKGPFSNFLPLHEAEALITGEEDIEEGEEGPVVPLWRTLVLSSVSLVETLLWLCVGCYSLIVDPENIWFGVRDFLVAATWFYATLRPILWPTATAPFDLFSLYSLHLTLAIVTFIGHIYDRYVFGIPMPTSLRLAVYIVNLLAISGLFTLVMNMPLAIPSRRVKKDEIGKTVSPEDYTTVWGWTSFRWIMPLLEKGTYNTLNEEDVWQLSPSMQARPLHIKFSKSTGKLLKRLWDANSLDLILDFVVTYVSVVFNYAGPFFLKRILDALDGNEPNPEKRAIAFIYAFLAFASSLAKAQADLQHLWIGRRACTRIRTELMAAIYDKALKRKDFSGIVDKHAEKDATPLGPEEDPEADDPKEGADIGKIVNLMAGDANSVSMIVSIMYFLYGAPFEIIIATVFLYQLLGWSAFAGFVVLGLSWPLNNFVARRSVRVQKGFSTARDKRMGVLNELISAVKFIKFFAWEDRWIQRALDAREVEMKWMVKARINSVLFSFIWTCAPILVSVTSFFVYVAQGNELTVGKAFTAIALYQMVRAPLNVIPTWIFNILQSKVSLDRIATYLDEEEVDEQVSSLKKGRVPPTAETETGLGIINGCFKWNEVEEKKEDKDKGKGKAKDTGDGNGTNGATDADETATAVDDASVTSAGAASQGGDHRFELRDINIMFPEGKLTVIAGPTASGKTALLMALLGELTTLEGRIVMSKNASMVDEHGLAHGISYAAQSPWLRHQSIKDNVLFGYPYDEGRYKQVLECCALKPDLEILEDGDATEIGARGVSLSGGQKARVALARAVYAPTKYVLLDDPLSAVDSHTSRFLFDKLFRGDLLANRTVILVTHHVELVLPGAHYLVRMLDGRIDTQGTISDLRESGVLTDIAKLEELNERQEADKYGKYMWRQSRWESGPDDFDKSKDKQKQPRKLVEEEHRETGNVKWRIYNTYLKASSYWTWAILCFLIVLTQLLGVGEKLWIKVWGEAYGEGTPSPSHQFSYSYRSYAEHQYVLNDGLAHFHHTSAAHAPYIPFLTQKITFPPAQEHPYFYIGIYSAIAMAAGFVNIAGVLTQYTGALRASRILFEKLLTTVVRATMRWHDVTPQGRMLNRFSKDVETVDSSLASTLQQVNASLALFAVSMLTVMQVHNVVFPLFIFPAAVLGFFYRRAAVAYLNTGRDIRRMESNTRSPIFANFSELLEGIVTVRAFSAEDRFLDDLYKKVDLTTQMWYTFWMTNRWLLLTFDTLGAAGILATTFFALSGYVDAGLAGVCITSAMSFTNSVYWACRFWTALELDLNSVERVVEYLDLPQEPASIIESNRPPAYWPSSTSQNKDSMLVVEDLVVKYAPDLPSVLHGVSFSLKAGERVGLLGRTGSGKSTLAMSILRFTDPAGGRILIDGIDICSIGLHDLRSRITFIPQDATLFSGTLRDNLDPFHEHTDAECLDVLHRVHIMTESQAASQRTSREASRAASRAASIHEGPTIASVSSSSPTELEPKAAAAITLDTQVSAGGTNFSQGQRQLIAMARALLRRSAIIVLDEATSSIDFATDAKIQATIREEFGGSMLLTVAHRLRTVIDYDRLIVLDQGKLVEFDTPLNLIQKEEGTFRDMCLKSGTFAELEAGAKAKADADAQRAAASS